MEQEDSHKSRASANSQPLELSSSPRLSSRSWRNDNRCLSYALRNLLPDSDIAEPIEDGPFWAMGDGNRFLASTGKVLMRVPSMMLMFSG
eukprot:9591161-Karenia_brevis.AAC.1